jgi:hypothetical protein
MSERQEQRDQRKRLFWEEKYATAGSEEGRLLVAFDEIRAAIADLPRSERDPARQLITKHLRQLPAAIAESQIHKPSNSQRPGQLRGPTRPGATRRRARREA